MSDVKLGTGQLSRLVTPVNLDGTVIAGGGGTGTIVLAVFRAIAGGAGYSIGDIIILRQTPPNAAEYFNATTSTIIATPNPADLGSVSSASNVSVTSSVLPTGASTSAKQDIGNTSLSSIDGKLPSGLTISSTRLLTDGSGVTQPISAASLPLPTGAATSANQSTANSSLSSIDGKLSAKATSAPTTSVASSATSVTLLNSNSNRKFASFRNDSTSVAYIELGSTATTSSVYKLAADGFMSIDNYTGAISCIWASVNGNMRISEGV